MQYRMIITSDEFKKDLLKRQDFLNPIKVLTINDAIDLLTFKIEYELVIEVAKHFDINYSIAKLYLETIRALLPEVELEDEMLFPLKEVRSFLKEEKYIDEVNLSLFKKCPLILEGYEEDFRLLVRLLDYYHIDYSYDFIKRKPAHFVVDEYLDKVEEVVESLNRVASLLYANSDIKLEDITILAPSSYHLLIKAVAELFSLDIQAESIKLKDLPYYQKLKRKLEIGTYRIKDLASENFTTDSEGFVISNLLSFYEDVSYLQLPLKLLLDYFDERALGVNVPNNKEGIRLLSVLNKSTDHLFIIGFTEELNRPIRDNDYLDDRKKEKLSFLPTSYQKNSDRTENYLTRLCNSNVVSISILKDEEISPLFEFDDKIFTKREATIDRERFSQRADLFLAAGYEFNERVYHIHHPLGDYLKSLNLGRLNSYDNSFKGAINSSLKVTSYSSLKQYFACPFSYYLNKVLKLNEIEDPFSINLGSIFHAILERYIKSGIWSFEYDERAYALSPKDLFYLNKLLEEFKANTPFIENTIKSFKSFEPIAEYSFTLPLTDKTDLVGRYDLVLENDDSYLIIDYKTGSEVFTYQAIDAGFSLQLPIYGLVARSEFKSKRSLGSFIFPIVKDEQSDLKLIGYTAAANELDLLLGDSYKTTIKVMKKGYSLSESEEEDMLNRVNAALKEAVTKIESGDFKIAPSSFGGKYNACKYCSYRDICFVKESQRIIHVPTEEAEDE